MKHFFTSIALTVGFVLIGPAAAQSPAPVSNLSPETVTVVIQITLLPGVKPDAASAAMSNMRSMIKKQLGFLSSELLQNINPANAPTNVHVARWASMKYWEGAFSSPEFQKLYDAGSKQYSVSASAFKTTP